jgi:hypothetical protein
MHIYIKQSLIILSIFLIILWIQTVDDKNKNIKRESTYDKLKLPLLVSAIIGLLLNIDLNNLFEYNQSRYFLVVKKTCINNPEVYLDDF